MIKTDLPREVERRMGIVGDDEDHVSVWTDDQWLFDCELPVWNLVCFTKQGLGGAFQYTLLLDPKLPPTWSNSSFTKWGRRWERLETHANQTFLYVSGITLVDLRTPMLFNVWPESQIINEFLRKPDGNL
jgi:hypothetical protein